MQLCFSTCCLSIVVVLKDIYNHSTRTISKECALKCNKNSYANIGTICKYLENTLSRNILHYYAIIGCDATLFFYMNGKINPLKEVLKNQVV